MAVNCARKSACFTPIGPSVLGHIDRWPADKVERWAIDRLIPYAKNACTHSDAQIAAIAASIKEWGCTTPALGIANYVEITSGSPRERTEITLLAEGKVELVMGTMSSGQGHEISFAQLVTEWGKPPNTSPPSRGRAHAREAAAITGDLMISVKKGEGATHPLKVQ